LSENAHVFGSSKQSRKCGDLWSAVDFIRIILVI